MAGRSQVLPSEKINLHFNGDKHAVAAAHNLLAALTDSHLFHGNELRIDPDNIFWPRAVDMNDRALRHVEVGLGGKTNGVPRASSFVITAASEVMAILALANSRVDCAQRLGEMLRVHFLHAQEDGLTFGHKLLGERLHHCARVAGIPSISPHCKARFVNLADLALNDIL